MKKTVFYGRAGTFLVVSAVVSALMLVPSGCKNAEGNGTSEKKARTDVASVATSGRVGQAAVPFALKTFDGKVFKLDEKRGKPVVVNFWASWCEPCRSEAALLRDAYKRFKKKGVVFVGVAVNDFPEESKIFIKEYGWTFPVGPDSTSEIMRAYRVFGIPKTFIIDASGRISYIYTGAIPEEVLVEEIRKVL